MNPGYDIELLFEQRLRQLGYAGACRPAREDCGVDYVVFTTKGWMGIQVKSAKRNNVNTKKRGMKPCNALRVQLKQTGHKARTVEYFRRCGVNVFALHYQGIFYLVPIERSGVRGVYCTIDSSFRESWHDVLGDPIEPMTMSEMHKQETAELETLFTLSEREPA